MECCCGVSDLISICRKNQKKATRNITNSHILVHTEPLLKDLGLLKVGGIFKLRLLKFYYKLMNNELPSYFMTYVPIITNEAYILNCLKPVATFMYFSRLSNNKRLYSTSYYIIN